MTRALLAQALDALVYHMEQTRPIQRTMAAIAALDEALAQPQAEPYGHVTTHTVTGQQFFYRHPEPPYLDTAKECIAVYAAPQAQPTPATYAMGYAEGFNDACAPAPVVPAWMPIETAPKDWQHFFACQAQTPEVGECTWDEWDERWVNPYDNEPLNWTPTHWMPLPPAFGIAASPPAPAVAEPLNQHLKEIYGWLADIAPEGIADEAFRNVPDALFPHSERTKLLPPQPAQRENASAVPAFSGQHRPTGARVDEAVAPAVAEPLTPFGMTYKAHLNAALQWLDTRRERLHHEGCSVHAPSAQCNCGLHKALTNVRAVINAMDDQAHGIGEKP